MKTSFKFKPIVPVFAMGLFLLPLMQGFKVARQSETRLFEALGMEEFAAKGFIWTSFERGYLYCGSKLETAKKMSAPEKEAVARELCNYVKSYFESDEFLSNYQKWRESYRPQTAPQPMDPALKAMQKENIESVIKQFEELMTDLPDDQKAAYQPAVDAYRQMLTDLDDPNPELTKWSREYPDKPDQLIAQRLRQFLEIAESVDYNAQLKDGPKGKKLFVNPAYEARSREWKYCFRAGKDVMGVAIPFVKAWLGEVEEG